MISAQMSTPASKKFGARVGANLPADKDQNPQLDVSALILTVYSKLGNKDSNLD